MAYKYEVNTKAELAEVNLNWSLELDNPEHMMDYQVYANTLIAAVIAKLGQYALELERDDRSISKGGETLMKALDNA
jgi:hypothetical protein